MRQRIDLDVLYAKAVRQTRAGEGAAAALKAPLTCPFTLDDLLADDLDVSALVARLRAAS